MINSRPVSHAFSAPRLSIVVRRSWAGPSWVAAPSSVLAGLHGKRSYPGTGGRSGLMAGRARLWQGGFSAGWILGNDRRFLLLLAENYNQAATDRTAERTETLNGQLLATSCLAILVRLLAAAPGCRSTWLPCPASCCARGSLPVGRTVRGCCAVVRAGRRPVGPEGSY